MGSCRARVCAARSALVGWTMTSVEIRASVASLVSFLHIGPCTGALYTSHCRVRGARAHVEHTTCPMWSSATLLAVDLGAPGARWWQDRTGEARDMER